MPSAGALIHQTPPAEILHHENVVAGGRGFKGAGRGSGGAGSISSGGGTHVSPQVCSHGKRSVPSFLLPPCLPQMHWCPALTASWRIRSLSSLVIQCDTTENFEQVSFAQMASGNKATPEQQFADSPHAGMVPPTMLLPSAALDPKAAARAAAAAAAGAKQKQLEVAAVVSSSAHASVRAQAAEEAKRKREEANRREQKRREAAEEAEMRNRQAAGLLQIKGASAPADSNDTSAMLQESANTQSTAVPQGSQPTGSGPQGVGTPLKVAQTTAAQTTAVRPIDTRAWPAIKPTPCASAPATPPNVWGARPQSIMQAPPPVDEKKSAVQQQKIVKSDNAPQQKNAWGKVKVGLAAEVKPGSRSTAPLMSPAKALNSKPSQLEGGPAQRSNPENEWESKAGSSNWLGDPPVEGASEAHAQMLQDFLRLGVQQDGQGGTWASENVHKLTEDSNDTDEVFFMRPNGVPMPSAPWDETKEQGGAAEPGKPERAESQISHGQPAMVKPSAWASRAPNIPGSMSAGFGQVDCPEGLMAFELSCQDADPLSNAGGDALQQDPGWGDPGLQVDTQDGTKQKSDATEEDQNKSPSVALKMMLGIGQGGTLPNEPVAGPPVARRLPVWGKPDGRMDISMDPAIAQIARDMPYSGTQDLERSRANGRVQGSNSNASEGRASAWEANDSKEVHGAQRQEVAPTAPMDASLQVNMQQQSAGRDMMHQIHGVQANPMQPMPQTLGAPAFLHSGPAQEQRMDMGVSAQMSMAMSDMAPQSLPFSEPKPPQHMRPGQGDDALRYLHEIKMSQGMAGPEHVHHMRNNPDPTFPFGMAAPPPTGGGLLNMPHIQPQQNVHNNMFGMGVGGMSMMPNRPGDGANMPPWMNHQQTQGHPMGINMGMMHNSGPRPGDNPNLPPWMQQHHQPDMGNHRGLPPPLPPPGMGMGGMDMGNGSRGFMGPMGGMGSGGGMDIYKMLGSGLGGMPDRNCGGEGSLEQGHSDPNGPMQMGGLAAGHPGRSINDGFGFGGGNSGGAGGMGTDGGSGGGFDFNKVFGNMSLGPSGNSQMQQMGDPNRVPGAIVRSLAGCTHIKCCVRLARMQISLLCLPPRWYARSAH